MATVNYSWTLPTVGASVNTWGTLLNTIIDDIDTKMPNKTAPVFTGGMTLSGGASITGNSTVTGTLGVISDSVDGSQLKITGATNQNYQTRVGFDTTNLLGKIQAIHVGTAYKDLVLQPDGGNLGLGVTPSGWGSSHVALQVGARAALWAEKSAGNLYLTSNLYFDGASWRYITTGPGAKYLQQAGAHVWSTITSGTAGTGASGADLMTLDASGNLLVGATSGTEHTLQKSAASGYAATITNTNSSNGYVLQLKSAATVGATWNLIDGFANSVAVFRVSGNGNVANYNNSYGSISSKEYKVNIVDTTPKLAKLLKYRVVNYSLKDDPEQLKQIGLIWEELYEISPGLCEETPEFADVEIEPARTEIKVAQRQKTRTEESTRYEVLLVDGQWTKLPVRTEVQVPLFDLHPLFEQDGSPVMEVAEPAIEASPALFDKDGNEVTPAVEAKPAVMRQVMFQVPVMEDVEETVEIPAKTESRPTGKTIKSVKYSVLVPMLVKAMQEQQAQIEELKAKVGA